VIELRIYRAAFFPALLAVAVVMFSLEDRPDPLPQGLPADVLFDEGAAAAQAERLAQRLAGRQDGRWLTAKEAAAHLGLSVYALHKLTAARAIPFGQDGPGCKLWFRRAELDRWRQGGGSSTR